jgi:ABC-2 type transport system ATP-binding protein
VLFSSHQLDLVQELCREVVIINKGAIVLSGGVDVLRESSPTRVLEVEFDRAAALDWAAALPDLVPVGVDGAGQRYVAPAGLDLPAVIGRAAAVGTVRRFRFEPHDLSEVFRQAVTTGPGAQQQEDVA